MRGSKRARGASPPRGSSASFSGAGTTRRRRRRPRRSSASGRPSRSTLTGRVPAAGGDLARGARGVRHLLPGEILAVRVPVASPFMTRTPRPSVMPRPSVRICSSSRRSPRTPGTRSRGRRSHRRTRARARAGDWRSVHRSRSRRRPRTARASAGGASLPCADSSSAAGGPPLSRLRAIRLAARASRAGSAQGGCRAQRQRLTGSSVQLFGSRPVTFFSAALGRRDRRRDLGLGAAEPHPPERAEGDHLEEVDVRGLLGLVGRERRRTPRGGPRGCTASARP